MFKKIWEKIKQAWGWIKSKARILLLGGVVVAATTVIVMQSDYKPSILDDGASVVEVESMKTWNADTYQMKDGKYATSFGIGWKNFLDSDLKWKPIDQTPVQVPDGFDITQGPFRAHAPAKADGVAQMINDNRWDVFNKKDIPDNPVTQTIYAIDVQSVSGKIEIGDLGFGKTTYIVYEGAYPQYNADLIYVVDDGISPTWRKIVRFNSNPNVSQNIELSFGVSYDKPMRFVRMNKVGWGESADLVYTGALGGELRAGKTSRGISFRDFMIWDSDTQAVGGRVNGKSEQIQIKLHPVSGNKEYILTKIIPKDFLDSAVYPVYTDTTSTFYPDAGDPGSTTCDTYEVIHTSTWALARAATTADNVGNTETRNNVVTNKGSVNSWDLERLFMGFDTTSIGSGSTITSSTLSLFETVEHTTVNTDSVTLHVVPASPDSNTTYTTSDINNLTFTSVGSVAYASIINDAYNVIPIATSSVNKIGVTSYAVIDSKDLINQEPTGLNRTQWYLADNGTNKPTLTVIYSGAASHSHRIIIISMVENLMKLISGTAYARN